MHYLERLDSQSVDGKNSSTEKVINHKLSTEFESLARYENSKTLIQSPEFKALKDPLHDLSFSYEYGCYADDVNPSASKSYFRAILWHLENGINYNGILETLRNRALVRKADIYFFPSTDIGMSRSGNRNVVRDLAIELGYNYFFATSFLNIESSDINKSSQQKNSLGLEGNAIMTRLPMSNLRYIALDQYNDTFKWAPKRIGCEKALLVDLLINEKQKLTIVCVNLPRYSSQRERALYAKQILSKIKSDVKNQAFLIGGDLKTSTYNTKSTGHFFLSVVNKLYRDFDFVTQEHNQNPELHFEKRLFDILCRHGFDYKPFNELGQGTFHSHPLKLAKPLFAKSEKLYQMLERFLKKYPDKLSYKYDWFAGNSFIKTSKLHQSERPKVINHLFFEGQPVSNHDPILLDFEVMGSLSA